MRDLFFIISNDVFIFFLPKHYVKTEKKRGAGGKSRKKSWENPLRLGGVGKIMVTFLFSDIFFLLFTSEAFIPQFVQERGVFLTICSSSVRVLVGMYAGSGDIFG